MALRHAFQTLLADSARLHDWTLIPELTLRTSTGATIRPDGTLRDTFYIDRGYWEAKDSEDDLPLEIQKKIDIGYPIRNTIFEDTQHAVLFQNRSRVFDADLSNDQAVADLLNGFYAHTEPEYTGLEEAIKRFEERIPALAGGLANKIAESHDTNPTFAEAFAKFLALCQASLNPNIRREAVDEMLIQHLLTERLFRRVFDSEEFTRRNAIAIEVESVIDALLVESFSRGEYLRSLDPFYVAIESAARTITDFSEKQQFLNNIYERFFRGYCVKVADTHGIVYTPPTIVQYMCNAVTDALKNEFRLSLSSPDVRILDPCTGTGNFIVHLMRRMPKRDLPRMYKDQLFANEVMLMPYYIASLNIEHAYTEATGHYEAFGGICFVDTLDITEDRQIPMFTKTNTERVNRQQKARINVIIGNPPYNVGQINENDNNKNRKYEYVDGRISDTYIRDSSATNKNALLDAYVRFFRWASDRLRNEDGVVCFVSNNGFLEGVAFDGFRMHLATEFDKVYHVDLKGDARTSGTRRKQEGGNVFNDLIRVGVGITLLVRNRRATQRALNYYGVPDYASAVDKQRLLQDLVKAGVPWIALEPNRREWITAEHADVFAHYLPIQEIFHMYSRGVATSRDTSVYAFDASIIASRATEMIELFNSEIDRYARAGRPKDIDHFVEYTKLKWSRDLKLDLKRLKHAEFKEEKVRKALYRPFSQRFLFFDRIFNEEVYAFPKIFPTPASENLVIVLSDIAFRVSTFSCLVCAMIPDLHLCSSDSHQCFPVYTYAPDGTEKVENITDNALQKFRAFYNDDSITKLNIFHYVYALLHHDGYRQKFAANLRRDLPRIPFAPQFREFVKAGEQLAHLHVDYEQLEPWPSLEYIENAKEPISYRVKRMRLDKAATAVIVNKSLTIGNIPSEASDYRIGAYSALRWIVDQYRATKDARFGSISDPNRKDDLWWTPFSGHENGPFLGRERH